MYTSMSNLSHGGEVAWIRCKAQLVVMKELITYKTWHGVMCLGREDQETWLGCDGPVASVKGKSEALERWTARGEEA